MSKHIVHIFISHAWVRSDHYDTLAGWISDKNWKFGQATVNFKDYSIPKSDPVHDADNDKQLRDAIQRKLQRTHVVVLPTGMYASHSKWIKKEIEIATNLGKPILAVTPRGQVKESSIALQYSSDHCGWNSSNMVSKIWGLYKDFKQS